MNRSVPTASIKIITAAAIVLLATACARASDLITPLVSVGDSGNSVCNVLNASHSPLQVTSLQFLDSSGNEVASIPSIVLSSSPLDPGHATNLSFSTNQATLVYCKVSINAAKKAARVSILVNDPAGTSMVGFAGN
jgi:hypothetical protein